MLEKLRRKLNGLKRRPSEGQWDEIIAEMENLASQVGDIEGLRSLQEFVDEAAVEWYAQRPEEEKDRWVQEARHSELWDKIREPKARKREDYDERMSLYAELAELLEANEETWPPQERRLVELQTELQQRIRLHDVLMEAVNRMITAKDPTFTPLYLRRKAFMLEQGYTEKEAEEEGRRFVATEFAGWFWAETHNKQWIPHDPNDPHAHEGDWTYPDKGMA